MAAADRERGVIRGGWGERAGALAVTAVVGGWQELHTIITYTQLSPLEPNQFANCSTGQFGEGPEVPTNRSPASLNLMKPADYLVQGCAVCQPPSACIAIDIVLALDLPMNC